MKKIMMFGVGLIMGMMLAECKTVQKPLKDAMKKIHIS